MRNLLEPATRDAVSGRIDRLAPDSPRRWGTMSPDEMVCHCIDQLRTAVGEQGCEPLRVARPLVPLLRLAALYGPWPKGRLPTVAEMQVTHPEVWDEDVARLKGCLARFATPSEVEWGVHPLFGALTGPAWARLSYRHLDHHLRQFGV